VALLPVLLLAVTLRWWGLDWDGGIGAHPDERYIVATAEALRWPDRLDPFDVAPDLAYGHLPLAVLFLLRTATGGADLLIVGRVLAALSDQLTVALTYALGRRVYGHRTGLLAATSITLAVSHVQQAHFYTADIPLATLTVATLYCGIRLAAGGCTRDACLAGVCAGLALGTKVTGALLALPLGAACVSAAEGSRARCARLLLVVGVAAVATFGVSNPFALLDLPTFWRNVAEQSAVAQGLVDVPYTRQYYTAWPYLHPLVQQMRWGLGWVPGAVALGGLGYVVWRAIRAPVRRVEWVLLAWSLPYLALVGALYAKFPRYLLPLTPVLAIYGAHLLLKAGTVKRVGRVLAPLAIGCLLLAGLLRCLGLIGLYDEAHPWLAASDWMTDLVPPGSVIAVEQWDHPLPLDPAPYDLRQIPIFDEDSVEKWTAIAETVAAADYLVIASRRAYASLPRWPDRYPLTTCYYRLLFGGELGFEPVACFSRFPHLGPLVLRDDPTRSVGFSLPAMCWSEGRPALSLGRLDESFVVYDHPQTIIFHRTPVVPGAADLLALIQSCARPGR
jgi:4-amino-4-deoxy-L-arabinose transferase-like glycosyltransferase